MMAFMDAAEAVDGKKGREALLLTEAASLDVVRTGGTSIHVKQVDRK